jgi:glycosyltransferase involved in cell wall biosynthesis
MLKRAEQVLCVSEVERQLLRRHFGLERSTVVVPNGVEVDEICGTPPKSVPSDQAVILTVGRLEHYKQTDRLVAAIPLLDPEAELVVVGDGPARTRIRQLAARLGVESRLQLMGPLARQDLLAWYRRADVFVSLSRHEAFGLTVLEAAVAGARIVASDIPAHREVAGYISPASMTFVATGCNSSTLADTINSLSRAHRPSGTTHHAPTWSTTAEGVLHCYQEVSRDRISESRAQAVA